MKIFVGPTSFCKFNRAPIELLQKRGIEVELNDLGRALTEDEIASRINEFDGILSGLEPLNRRVLSEAKKLKVISRVGAGLDNVDLQAARDFQIPVEYTPDGPTDAVAELTLGLILDLCRKISLHNGKMKNGVREKKAGMLLKGKTIGIVGLGRIGKKVAHLLDPFGVTLLYYDPYLEKPYSNGERVELDELLERSQFISLHIPVSDETREIIDSAALDKMRKDAFVINASRGGLVDEEALYKKLKEGELAGAALDTFREEPYKGKLLELDNVVATPHIGSLTEESRIAMETEAVENLLKHL